MSESFFSRWSRRKQEASEDSRSPAAAAPQAPSDPALDPALDSVGASAGTARAPTRSAADTPNLPTLQDAQSLTPQSDFQPFMQRGVGPEVRNAAMKKLFADPHFNVMDGLDVYIDDYNLPDPLPAGMLARMASAQFMKLVPEPAAEPGAAAAQAEALPRHPQDPAEPGGPEVPSEVVAQSPLSLPNAAASAPSHDHPDLQLQPDLAPADPDPGSRPG